MDLKTALSIAYNKPIAPTSLNKEPKPRGNYKGKHALRPYLGIVEYPISRGGGSVWIKSAVALRNYEDLNYKVVWL
jgi:hypothetical protein